MDTSRFGARRAVRVEVAVVFTLLLAIQVATLVLLVVKGGPEQAAWTFFMAGVWGLFFGWMSAIAWRWVARARHEQGLRPPLEGVLDEGVIQDHLSLTGEVEPPQRW